MVIGLASVVAVAVASVASVAAVVAAAVVEIDYNAAKAVVAEPEITVQTGTVVVLGQTRASCVDEGGPQPVGPSIGCRMRAVRLSASTRSSPLHALVPI